MKFATLVFKNLLRSRRRTILTVLSIAVSLFIFSALISLPTVANRVLADTASSVRIACRTKMGLAYPLPEAYKAKIAATPHVVAVTPDNFFGGTYHEISDQFPNIAVDPQQIDVMWPDWGFSPGGVEQFKDREPAASTWETFESRMTAADRSKSLVPAGTRERLFRVVYRFENEQLLELINRTAHAAALSALIETANSYRFYFGVYVRSVSRFTPIYMALIDPFRKLVVYPPLLRTVRSNWNQTFGTA